MTKNEKQRRGAENRSAGLAFEGYINEVCAMYERAGRAIIHKIAEPMRPLYPAGNGRFMAVFLPGGYPDYGGVLAGGQSIFFEAKYTSTDRIESGRVTEKQAAALEAAYQMGACVFVLLMYPDMYARVPWAFWRALADGHKYITRREAEIFRIRDWTGRPCFLDGDILEECTLSGAEKEAEKALRGAERPQNGKEGKN